MNYLNYITECRKQYMKIYYENNKEKLNRYIREYQKKNKDKIKEQRNKHTRERRKTDTIFNLRLLCRSRIYSLMKNKGYKKNKTTMDMIGCSLKELKTHLEKQFTLGMNWKNIGYGWHIDHIIPLATATIEEEIYALCHYTNLQPLWATENLKKGKNI